MTDSILFVYFKNGNLKAIELSCESKKQHDELIADGWTHTTTIDSKAFLIDLLKDSNPNKIVNKIKLLHKKANN